MSELSERMLAATSKPRIEPAVLALEDGTVFEGRSCGAHGETCGELCFNTSLEGYLEVVTDQRVLDFTQLMRNAQKGGTFVKGGVRALIRGDQPDSAVFERIGKTAFRFQKGMFGPWGREMTGEDMFGAGNGFGSVSAGNMFVCLNIAFFSFKNQRSVRFGCFFRGADERQDLIFDFDQFLCRFQ